MLLSLLPVISWRLPCLCHLLSRLSLDRKIDFNDFFLSSFIPWTCPDKLSPSPKSWQNKSQLFIYKWNLEPICITMFFQIRSLPFIFLSFLIQYLNPFRFLIILQSAFLIFSPQISDFNSWSSKFRGRHFTTSFLSRSPKLFALPFFSSFGYFLSFSLDLLYINKFSFSSSDFSNIKIFSH